MTDRTLFVSVDLGGNVILVGRLFCRSMRGKEGATFQYEPSWLSHPERFALEPALDLVDGTFHTMPDRSLFGAIGDSAPDRWGRILMRRFASRNRLLADSQVTTLTEADYLLGVYDEARQGALRFSEVIGGPYLQQEGARSIPPLIALPKLLYAAENVLEDHETDEDIRLLLAPGSSLGGARPKASVRDHDGQLAIAKFPRKDDEYSTVLWEAVALTLAKEAGITVPEWRIEWVGEKPILILRRFDRLHCSRIPFLSAMSMLGAKDNEQHSYLEILDAIRQHGAAPDADVAELWRRMLLNILISNTDDHLRNHGFLYERYKGWRLSPAYDINPTPVEMRPRVLTTTIDYDDGSASLELAYSVAKEFGLTQEQAQATAREMQKVVSTWQRVAKELGIRPREIERMASAFTLK